MIDEETDVARRVTTEECTKMASFKATVSKGGSTEVLRLTMDASNERRPCATKSRPSDADKLWKIRHITRCKCARVGADVKMVSARISREAGSVS